jgi:hypothetical protein
LLSLDIHEKGSIPQDDIVLDLEALIGTGIQGTTERQTRPAPSPEGRGVG